MEQQKPTPNSLSWVKKLVLMSTGSVALISLLFGVSIWRSGYRFVSGLHSIFNPPPSTPQIHLPTSIITKIKEANELTTAVFVTESVIPTSQERKLGQFVVAETNLLYVAYGEVRAGVNLNSLTEENIKIENDTVVIKLPAPIILDSKIDVNRSGVYHYDRGLLSLGPDVAPQLQTMAQRRTLNQIVNTACNQGVLEEANEQAEKAIAHLLSTTGYKIQVETTAVSRESCGRNL